MTPHARGPSAPTTKLEAKGRDRGAWRTFFLIGMCCGDRDDAGREIDDVVARLASSSDPDAGRKE